MNIATTDGKGKAPVPADRQKAALTFTAFLDIFIARTDHLVHGAFTEDILMAQHKSAEKRARASRRRAKQNTQWKSRMRNAIRQVRATKEKPKALEVLKKTVKLLDQLAAKGIIHKNKAANNKARLTRFVNALK